MKTRQKFLSDASVGALQKVGAIDQNTMRQVDATGPRWLQLWPQAESKISVNRRVSVNLFFAGDLNTSKSTVLTWESECAGWVYWFEFCMAAATP